jgi:uncharacterized membrane protein YeaQ/YmgE (transglycosylase-associated protein family)
MVAWWDSSFRQTGLWFTTEQGFQSRKRGEEQMGIISSIILGLIVGALAKWIMPGRDPGGIFITIIIGIVGSFLGGLIGSLIDVGTLSKFSFLNILLSLVGALILLGAYRLLKRGA